MNANKNLYKAAFHATKGNEKCHYANTGFPALTTCHCACKYGCECAKEGKCYALLQELQYTDKMKADWENLLLYNEDPEAYKKAVIKFMEENGEDTLRWFESGDSPDEEFFPVVVKGVADVLKDKRFYGYTKEHKEIDFIHDVPVWQWENVNLMMSEWGDYKVDEETRKYYKVFKVIPIWEIDEAEAEGYVPCSGNCGDGEGQCNICKYGTANVYCVLHGSRAIFPIPEEYKTNEKVDVNTDGFIKFGGKTIGGLRDAYCKAKKIEGYENRIQALKDCWRMIKNGSITIWKNGFVLKNA